jgi:hypothetical protein
MNGLYFFGDFILGKTWAASQTGTSWSFRDTTLPSHFVSTYGEDESGQLYLADYFSGKIYRLGDSGLAQPPEFSPAGGVVPTDQIIVDNASPGATIYYTTNGLVPTTNDLVVASQGAVTVINGTTLSARSFRGDLQPSTVTMATYVLQAGIPIFSPGHGPITNRTLLSMTSATPGAAIYFTLDGTDPSPSATLYAGPIPINSTNVVSARAFKTGFNNSPIQRVYFSGAVALQLVTLSNGTLVLRCPSDSGRTYQMQTSSDLIFWTDTHNPVAGTGGSISFLVDPSQPWQYLRLRIY